MKNILLLVGLVAVEVSAQSVLDGSEVHNLHTGMFMDSGGWKHFGTAGFLGDEWEFGAHPKDGGVRFSAALWQNDVHLVEAWSIDAFFPSGTIAPGTYIVDGDINTAGFSAQVVHEKPGSTSTSFAADYVQLEVLEAQYKGSILVASAIDVLFMSTDNGVLDEKGNPFFFASFRDNASSPFTTNPQLVPVPEPTTYALFGGLCLAGFVARRRFIK